MSKRSIVSGIFVSRVIALSCAMMLALTGCAAAPSGSAQGVSPAAPASGALAESAAPAGEPAEGGDFVFGIATEVTNFDPFTVVTADAKGIYFNIYEGLVKTSPEGDFVPAVADSAEMSEDAATYTFHLREGVKFHNGNEVTMEDVTSSIQRAIDGGIAGYANIASFEPVDERTLEIKLTNPDTGFLAYMTTAIVPKDAQDLALAPIGTGPFKFTEYAEQDHVTLEKFEEYWGEKAHLDKVTVKFIAGSSEQLIDFQAGTIDAFEGAAGLTEQLDKDSIVMHTRNSNSVQLLALNNKVEPFTDVRVRQALCYAVDAQEIIDIVNYGYGVKAGSPVIPGLSKYYNEATTDAYAPDVEKAKELLKEAGYENGFTFKITVPSNYQVHVDSAQVIVNQMERIGVKAEIQLVDWATWLESTYKGRQYEATLVSVDGSIAYPTAFLSRYVSDASNNFVNFNSEAYDAKYKEAVAETDDEKKVALFKEAQQILSDEAASVYIQDMASISVYNKGFDGFCSYPLYANDFSAIYAVK